ncbi:hypothetical protein PtrSN002B_000722 [Pyrenophora tritici-repentis]|uniref:Uncharacterized protein n=1 Tax=Pyrenophora tritici-repentis TaxID=45151 RepID=A0A2W1F116_9PLEO|nr:hypothetical protein PtrV1_04180 [Pyrenophora tritici-repentis]KAF7451865.1 hypothetical protein A1F99_036420 [Pyrenophora tritici-repentis]KAF7575012.1 hypothetical protein PtrM4_066360 [Pyrenophora tritici-repentis]KAG9386222.1 hypothetical protein A1F94_002972 [Pyrenophora tritici-repentis]KAI0589989.1 hypothetical protein Alg215_00112 [Pyrenophora tritici-repentis]
MQTHLGTAHLLAAILDYPPVMDWLAMTYTPGRNISGLMQMQYQHMSMPPCVVFDMFAQLVQVQAHLSAHRLCHADLNEGRNVMLIVRERDA